jgi:ABC-type sugar transport system permease subunit
LATITARVEQEEAHRRPSLWARIKRYYWGYIFISPWVLLYAVFGIYPLLLSFFLTFFNYSFVNPEQRAFVGMGNWLQGTTDPLFWTSVFNIGYNQTIFILLKNGLGLLAAVLVKQAKVGGRFFRTVYFMPVLTSVMVLMVIGGYLASPTGPVQTMLVNLGVLSEPVFWTFSRWLPMPVIALINTWKWFGISFVILLAGLYSIDPQLYEAAAIDGASLRRQFLHITLPLLAPQMFFLFVVDVINGLQMFTEVFTLFNLQGGSEHQALTPVLYLYGQAFDQANIGYASALGLLLAALIAIITFFQFRFFRDRE